MLSANGIRGGLRPSLDGTATASSEGLTVSAAEASRTLVVDTVKSVSSRAIEHHESPLTRHDKGANPNTLREPNSSLTSTSTHRRARQPVRGHLPRPVLHAGNRVIEHFTDRPPTVLRKSRHCLPKQCEKASPNWRRPPWPDHRGLRMSGVIQPRHRHEFDAVAPLGQADDPRRCRPTRRARHGRVR